ncbi:YciI family protein [Isoptericola jiangsuensis]|uniref:YciI family protein n=1 Tax=Isoptericola jiangsuensis TaxID=548579 RepID=UPI003AAC915B
MTKYLISFDDGSMDAIPDADLPAVAEAAHAVTREAKAAGVWVFGGGLQRQQALLVGTDGTVRPGPNPETKAVVGGFCVVDVATRDEAVVWAARTAAACRCVQEVREIMDDPES